MATSPDDARVQKAFGWAARDASGILSPFHFNRRTNGDNDVTLKVLYCGICHTDLHTIKNDFGFSVYPVVPGHEIVGEVTHAEPKVQKFRPGDKVGVGYIIGSCRTCESCKQGLENYCPDFVPTFRAGPGKGDTTYGGYSNFMVVDEDFVIRIPDCMPLDGAAPLLCAGITVCSAMKYYGLCVPGADIGVVGLGGLGHVAVRFAKAFGMKVTVISTSPSKRKEAIESLGVDSFLISSDLDQMKAAAGSMDDIIDTVSAPHSLPVLIDLLKKHGKLIMVGATNQPLDIYTIPILMGRKLLGGSMIGGIKETQEMMDFAAQHKIVADIEVVPMSYVNTAMLRLAKGDVKYRFVIDVANTLALELAS